MVEMHISPFLCAIEINIEVILNCQMYNIPGVGFKLIGSEWVFYSC